MQFQVPQFIDTEDKIVGPFSLRQFAFIGVAGLLSALLYFMVQFWLFIFGVIIFFGFALALAFVKVEGRPFFNVLLSAFNYYWRPQTYVWQPDHTKLAEPMQEVKADAGKSALEEILSKSAAKMKSAVGAYQSAMKSTPAPAKPISRETVQAGSKLHQSWADLQTGAPLTKKNSDKEFLEKKMMERYQILQRISGDRHAAKRVDYR
jgi:hypothetical protein